MSGYYSFPDLKVVFTSSTALDLYRGESDVSGRSIVQYLAGLSFREYLAFIHGYHFNKISLTELLKNHQQIATEIAAKVRPLAYFYIAVDDLEIGFGYKIPLGLFGFLY